jgi:branched-chain amino acid transport system substrate-binding protein
LGTWSFDQDGDTTLTEVSGQRLQGSEFGFDRVIDVEGAN